MDFAYDLKEDWMSSELLTKPIRKALKYYTYHY